MARPTRAEGTRYDPSRLPPHIPAPLMKLTLLAPLGALVLSACSSLPTPFSRDVVYVIEASGGA